MTELSSSSSVSLFDFSVVAPSDSYFLKSSCLTLGVRGPLPVEFDRDCMNFFNCFLWKTIILLFIILECISFLNLKDLNDLAMTEQASYSPFVQINLFLRIILVTGMVTTVRSGKPLELPQNWLLLSIIKPISLTFLLTICGLKFLNLSCSLRSYPNSSLLKLNRIIGPPSVSLDSVRYEVLARISKPPGVWF